MSDIKDKEIVFCTHAWDKGECRKCHKFADNLVKEYEKRINGLDICNDLLANKIVRKTTHIFRQRKENERMKQEIKLALSRIGTSFNPDCIKSDLERVLL